MKQSLFFMLERDRYGTAKESQFKTSTRKFNLMTFRLHALNSAFPLIALWETDVKSFEQQKAMNESRRGYNDVIMTSSWSKFGFSCSSVQ